MELGGLFASTDNLFKFLFIGGITLIVLSLVYPMQKEQLIELEINTHNKETALLNNEIDVLNCKVNLFKSESSIIIKQLDSLVNVRNGKNIKLINEQIEKTQKDYNVEFLLLKEREQEIITKNTILKFNKKKIELLNEHLTVYEKYSYWLIRVGIIFTVIGLVFWSISTIRSEMIKKKELRKLE